MTTVSHTNYVQQLWAMKATKKEDPLVFVERFRAFLVQTGCEDTVMQVTMLLNALMDAYTQATAPGKK
jgi:hypothetical protein